MDDKQIEDTIAALRENTKRLIEAGPLACKQYLESLGISDAPASPPAPAIEGKEEDKNVVLRWVKASGRLPTKFGMYVCIVKVYDDGHTFTPASFVQFDTIKGDWSNPSACGAEGKVLEWLEEISPPTPPAGAEGEGEKKEEILNAHCPLEKFNQIMDACNFDFDKMVYDCMSEFAAWKLCAAHAKIAELEQTIREQKEWINSHR